MNRIIKFGLAVVIVSLIANMLFRGGADKDADIPALVKNGALLIDTRTAGEFTGGHIEGAINIPYDIIGNVISNYEADKSRPIVVYCHSGARSASAKKQLQHAGYTYVVNGGGLHHMVRALGQ